MSILRLATACQIAALKSPSCVASVAVQKHSKSENRGQQSLSEKKHFHSSSPLAVQPSKQNFSGGNYLSDPENKGKRQSGVNFDTLGSWNGRLELPLNVEQSLKSGRLVPTIPLKDIGVHSLLGRRKENEDRYRITQVSPDILMVAVFDGHGGPVASEYVCKNLESHIQFWLERESKLTNVLHKSFIEANNTFTKYLYHNFIGNDEALRCGTTATVALLRNGVELVVAQVGDSKALLCRGGTCITLSDIHNLDRRDEKDRIERSGGHVTLDSLGIPRVNGRLEMTRSIGDVELKPYGVIAEPSLRSIEVKHGSDAFLVLLTDGITYVLNDQEIIDIMCTSMFPREAARFCCDQALHYGTEDNCTAVVVPFASWGKYSDSKKIQFSFGRNIVGKRYS